MSPRPLHSLAVPPASGIAPFQKVMEAKAGGRAQLHAVLFLGVPNSLSGTHGRRYAVPYGRNTSNWQASAPFSLGAETSRRNVPSAETGSHARTLPVVITQV